MFWPRREGAMLYSYNQGSISSTRAQGRREGSLKKKKKLETRKPIWQSRQSSHVVMSCSRFRLPASQIACGTRHKRRVLISSPAGLPAFQPSSLPAFHLPTFSLSHFLTFSTHLTPPRQNSPLQSPQKNRHPSPSRSAHAPLDRRAKSSR